MIAAATPGFPLLTSIVVLPALAALLVALIPRQQETLLKLAGFGLSIAVGVLSVILAIQFDGQAGGFQFLSEHEWIPELGVQWKLGVDGISLWLVVLTGILFPIAIAGPTVHKDVKSYMAWLLLLEAGCMGVFLALDLLVFFFFLAICFRFPM